MSTRIGGRLPGGDHNGLDVIEKEAREHPERPVMLVVLAHVKKVTTNIGDDGDPYTVQLGITQIEAIRGDGQMFVGSELNRAYEERTGKTPLPFGSVLGGETSIVIDRDEPRDLGGGDA